MYPKASRWLDVKAMVRAVELIERDLAALEEAIAALAEEFHNTYDRYLTALGQAVRQQLIMASYHLCTQGYPQPFLSLSFSHRQDLQQAIRQLALQAAEQLMALVEKQPLETPPAPDSQVPQNGESVPPSEPQMLKSARSEQLAQWQENLERAIAQIIVTVSHDTNRLLQQTEILPQKLPEALLEAAGKAEVSGEVTVGPPNLLNLLVETENSEDSESSSVTHIVAIHLRLSEIEFADSASMAGRNQIRQLSSRLGTLRREYHKKQRERIIASAEAAWRSTWFED